MRCSTSSRVLAQLDLLWYFMMSKAYQNVVYLLPKVLHVKLANCKFLHSNSSEFRFLYSSMACFAIGPQVITHFSQDRVQQRLHPQRELYTMSATRLCTLVSPSLPCACCRRVDPTRRVQRVQLFLCSFVLYMPWIPGEHRRGICAVECVAAHLRGFEEVSE